MFKEGCRIEVFADELRRRSAENQRNAQSNSTTLSERRLIDIDNSTAENLAKEKNLWIEVLAVILYGLQKKERLDDSSSNSRASSPTRSLSAQCCYHIYKFYWQSLARR